MTKFLRPQVLPVPCTQSGQTLLQPNRRPEHLFIHTVRFWSMVAIVFLHSAARFGRYQHVNSKEAALLAMPFKFGTIAFFIISGFLVGDRLPTSNPLGYLRRRAHRLLPAWLVWYGIELFYSCERDLLHAGRSALSLGLLLSVLRTESWLAMFNTPLWFVPNLLVALACVVLLRKWLDDLRLGAALLAVNVFYGVNAYTAWVPTPHTEAIFGFVFFLWLGAWCALRKDSVVRWAQAVSGRWLAFWTCVAAGAAFCETLILWAHGQDGMNTLRISNQIFSVLVVLLLIRIRRRSWPSFVNVAETTYGTYLLHTFVINLMFAAAGTLLFAHGRVCSSGAILLLWIVMAPIAYVLSLQVTRAIASSPHWSWAVGATNLDLRKWATRSAPTNEPMTRAEERLSNA